MPGALTSYRIFIATPGGLDEERRAFRDCVVEFNDDTANPRGVHFIPVGWGCRRVWPTSTATWS